MAQLSQTDNPDLRSQAAVVRRLLGLTWRYRAACLRCIGLQFVLLTLGIFGLSLTGVAIDFLRGWLRGGRAVVAFRGWTVAPPPGLPPIAVVAGLAALIVVLAGLRSALNYGYAVRLNRLVEQSFTVDLRGQIYEHLQNLSFPFFAANSTGSIIARATADVQSARLFVDQVLIQGAITLISVTVCIGYMASLNAGLAAACLGTTPCLCLLAVRFSRRIQPEYARNRALYDRMLHHLTESVRGIATLKGFDGEGAARQRFEAANAEVFRQQSKIFWQVSLFTPTAWLLTRLNTVVLLCYGGWLVLHRNFPLGSGLIVFAGLLDQVGSQVNTVAGIANSAQQALIGARRVFEILDLPLEVRNAPGARRCARLRGDVRFERVSFASPRGDSVLRELDLHVESGQCVAILGATGAGKSLLMSLLPRYCDATAGRVLIDGCDVRDYHLDDLRRNIGMVFQESFLFSNTVAANIAFGHPEATRAQIEAAAQAAAAHEFIRRLPQGYDTVLSEGGASLSGGQRQRLAIARALLTEPPILLLDDPTAAIDSETEHEIYEGLKRAARGRTTLIVAHRLSTLQRADVVIVLQNGRIAQQGTHAELMAISGPYREIARVQLVDGAALAGPQPGASPR